MNSENNQKNTNVKGTFTMEIKSVFDQAFRLYGRVLEGYDMEELLAGMMETECPKDSVIYVPGDEKLESLAIYKDFMFREYGGLPIQIGYCNGYNKALNALEYHRTSEIDIAAGSDCILLLGKLEDVAPDFTYDTAKVEAFLLPAGTGVELFATSLHYAPVTVEGGEGFRCVIILPKDTNTELEVIPEGSPEDKLITAKNKWLIAHADAGIDGAFVGLKGENITLA